MTVFVSDADHEGLHCGDEDKLKISKEKSRLLFVLGQLQVPTGPLFMVFLGPLELGYSLWKTLLPNHSCLREKTRLRCPFLNFRNPLKVVQENEIILVILFLLIYLRHQFHLYLDCYKKYY